MLACCPMPLHVHAALRPSPAFPCLQLQTIYKKDYDEKKGLPKDDPVGACERVCMGGGRALLLCVCMHTGG